MVGGNWSSWGKWEEIGRARGREREICSLPIYPIPFARSPRPRFRSCVPLFGSLIPSFAGGGLHFMKKSFWVDSWKEETLQSPLPTHNLNQKLENISIFKQRRNPWHSWGRTRLDEQWPACLAFRFFLCRYCHCQKCKKNVNILYIISSIYHFRVSNHQNFANIALHLVSMNLFGIFYILVQLWRNELWA